MLVCLLIALIYTVYSYNYTSYIWYRKHFFILEKLRSDQSANLRTPPFDAAAPYLGCRFRSSMR